MKKFFKFIGFIISVVTASAALLCGIGYFFKTKKDKINNLFKKNDDCDEVE